MFDTSYLKQQLQWRYATKKFDANRKLDEDQVNTILESMRLAPSAYGVQPWHFVVITDPKIREKLRAVSFDQSQVTDASHLIVVAHRTTLIEKDVDDFVADIVATRNQDVESLAGYRDLIVNDLTSRAAEDQAAWSARQSYIALGFGLQTAALMEIDACPMEGFEPEKVSDLLGLTEKGYMARAYLALGYRDQVDEYQNKEKVRFDTERIITRM